MDISAKYEQLAVKVKCKGLEGSGCLFQPESEEFTYVLTAKHCLEGEEDSKITFTKEDIIIKRFEANEEDVPLNVIDIKLHEELDVAVIIVEYINGLPSIGISKPVRKSEVAIYGYPKHLENSGVNEVRQNLPLTVSWFQNQNGIFELTAHEGLMTYFNGAPELVKGFSGCGVFNEIGDELELVGIFKGLKSPTGAYRGLCAVDINEITLMLGRFGLPDLTPSCLRDFRQYIDTAFDCHDRAISTILTEKAKEIRDISPRVIASILNEKLFLPYGKKVLTNPEIWNGWIVLLTYMCFDKEEGISHDNFCSRQKDGESQNVKLFYTNSIKTLEDAIRHLITELYDDLKHKDYIVINGEVPGTLFLSNERIQKIVKQIDTTVLYRNKRMIDDPYFTKDISCVHLHRFAIKISEIEERDNLENLYEQIRDQIRGVFENAI